MTNVNLNIPPRLIEAAREAQYENRDRLNTRQNEDKIKEKIQIQARKEKKRKDPLSEERLGGQLEFGKKDQYKIWTKKRILIGNGYLLLAAPYNLVIPMQTSGIFDGYRYATSDILDQFYQVPTAQGLITNHFLAQYFWPGDLLTGIYDYPYWPPGVPLSFPNTGIKPFAFIDDKLFPINNEQLLTMTSDPPVPGWSGDRLPIDEGKPENVANINDQPAIYSTLNGAVNHGYLKLYTMKYRSTAKGSIVKASRKRFGFSIYPSIDTYTTESNETFTNPFLSPEENFINDAFGNEKTFEGIICIRDLPPVHQVQRGLMPRNVNNFYDSVITAQLYRSFFTIEWDLGQIRYSGNQISLDTPIGADGLNDSYTYRSVTGNRDYHFAYVYKDDKAFIYFDGQLIKTSTYFAYRFPFFDVDIGGYSYAVSYQVTWGEYGSERNSFESRSYDATLNFSPLPNCVVGIQSIRFTGGQALYTGSSFVPPTAIKSLP